MPGAPCRRYPDSDITQPDMNANVAALAAALVLVPATLVAQDREPFERLAHVPAELHLADGDLRVVNLYALQGRILHEMLDESADAVVQRMVDEVYAPYTSFWNGYLGDEADFRDWTVDLLDAAHPIHARMASVVGADLDGHFTTGVDWIRRTTGRRPTGTWYLVFGPGWTDMGGLGGIGMVADFTRMEADSARIADILPHELTHQVHAAADDPDAGTVLHRIVSEGFASYVAFVHGAGRMTPARALGYSPDEWAWAVAHEDDLFDAVRPILRSREREHTDLVASRGEQLIPGAPGAGGYFLGFRIMQAYVAARGPDSWMEVYELPAARVLERARME